MCNKQEEINEKLSSSSDQVKLEMVIKAAGIICKYAGITNTENVDAINLLVIADNIKQEVMSS